MACAQEPPEAFIARMTAALHANRQSLDVRSPALRSAPCSRAFDPVRMRSHASASRGGGSDFAAQAVETKQNAKLHAKAKPFHDVVRERARVPVAAQA